jgi:MFS family permease
MALQALVALAVFAPGVLAPKLGIDARQISLFAMAVFAVGIATSLIGGMLAARIGSFAVAAMCALAVAAAMAIGMSASTVGLIAAGAALGLAFGPETPGSSALLARLGRPQQRPLIFSVRQTGNQIGAIIGSLALPTIDLVAPALDLAVIAALVLWLLVAFLALRRL